MKSCVVRVVTCVVANSLFAIRTYIEMVFKPILLSTQTNTRQIIILLIERKKNNTLHLDRWRAGKKKIITRDKKEMTKKYFISGSEEEKITFDMHFLLLCNFTCFLKTLKTKFHHNQAQVFIGEISSI